MKAPSETIEIVEVSPRDGLQNEPSPVSSRDKLGLIQHAASCGANRIEAVSFVSLKAVPQMADAERVMQLVREETDLRKQGVTIAGLVLNERGADRALRADVDEVNLVVLASGTFNRRNQGASVADTMKELSRAAALVKSHGLEVSLTIGAAFGCPFEGEVELEAVIALALEAEGFGLREVALADTIGVADPVAVERRILALRQAMDGLPVRCHFHDTRNTGLANAFSAWRAGATVFDASIGGIGGCPFAPAATGNIATEDLEYMFSRMGLKTGLNLDQLRGVAGWLERDVLRKPVPSALLRSGGFPPRRPETCS
jgi:hydroxymethylglutaryl-CoA lyase